MEVNDIFPSVNTLTTILAVTCAILLAAVMVSFYAMKDGVANAPANEMQRIQRQLDQIRMEQDKLQLESQLRDVRGGPAAGRNAPSEVTRMRDELAEKDAEIAALAEQKSDAEKKADTIGTRPALSVSVSLRKTITNSAAPVLSRMHFSSAASQNLSIIQS